MKIDITINIPPEEISQVLGDTSKLAAEIQTQMAKQFVDEMTKSNVEFVNKFFGAMSR